MLNRLFIALSFILYTGGIIAQNLVVDGAPVLLPRLTSAERDALMGIEGMIIFNSDAKKFQGFVGGAQLLESAPAQPGMMVSLDLNYISFVAQESGILSSVEIYTENAGSEGSLLLSSVDLCMEPGSSSISSTITSISGWNSYTFPDQPVVNSGTTYYLFTNSGVVTANASQADLEAIGSGSCPNNPQTSDFTVRIHIDGNWIDLY